jgi:hypothetical protein
MRIPRHSHTATLLPDGEVLLAGGYDAGGRVLAEAELYDPREGRFVPAGAMDTARAGHVAVSLADGRVLLVGGVGEGWTFLATAELYDPAAAGFRATGSMRTARESHAAVRLLDGRVLVIGGHQGRWTDLRILADAEAYDPATGRFAPAGRMAVPRHKHDAVLLFSAAAAAGDGEVLITGGYAEGRGPQAAAWLFRSAGRG